jgi:hypothetical protein
MGLVMGVCCFVQIYSWCLTFYDVQDIHPGNIVFNHDAFRFRDALSLSEEELAIPFHSTFDCRYAFIDFGSAFQFQLDAKRRMVDAGYSRPPTFFAAPEQDGESPL